MTTQLRTIKRRGFNAVLAAAALLPLVGTAHAQPGNPAATELRLGLGADVVSLDPHWLNAGPSNALATHLFDTLVQVDADGRLVPGLAESWKAVTPTTWEFRLRKGVKFHDGQELTADDVVFSLDRPAALANSPGSFTSFTKVITAKEVVDAHTLRLTTAAPYGPLTLNLASIFIVSKKAAAQATQDDFNQGRAAVGTGPFRYGSFKRGDSIELLRNDAYWGAKPAWGRVTFRILTNDAARLTALLSGAVDGIESVPSGDIAKVKANPALRLEQRPSWRTLFWHLDQSRDASPFITDKAGKPLARNPLKDPRVRQALSKAIDRKALVERTLEGQGLPASNLNTAGAVGYADSLKVEAYDPEGARRLLAEAGYPDGFALTLHGPNNRYVNDEQIVQTTAQFWSRIGLQVKVETQPVATYFGKARNGDFSVALLGWGSLAADFTLRDLLGTVDPATGWGSWNWGRYSNPKLDAAVQASLAAVDAKQREQLAEQAVKLALADHAAIPLHHQQASWAVRKGIRYAPRVDEFTFAHQFRPE